MQNFDDNGTKRGLDRRPYLGVAGLGVAGAAGAVIMAGAIPSPAAAEANTPPRTSGRHKIGSLEISSVGFGVPNVSRKYETTVPYRPEMINIIRAAYDHGVTFFGTAEAYGGKSL